LKLLGTAPSVALLALFAALVVSPDLRLDRWLPAADGVFAAVGLLLVVATWIRASTASDRFVALGLAVVTLSVGYDTLRGHRGRLTLVPGAGTRTFEEFGRGGRVVGGRPLGFDLLVRDVDGQGRATLEGAGEVRVVTPRRAVGLGGYRLGSPRAVPTATAQLRLAVDGPGGTTERVVLGAVGAVRASGLEIALDRYFPDFALDERQQPLSRSDEPRNPAALLQVQKGDSRWRVFVIRAMPGVHRPEGLDRVIRLEDVEPELAVGLSVSQDPTAPLAGFGLLLVALGAMRSRA
jgi:hypothetical protein